jgi:hypothetical protein
MKRVAVLVGLVGVVLLAAAGQAEALIITNTYDPADIFFQGPQPHGVPRTTHTFTHDLTVSPGEVTSATTGATSPSGFNVLTHVLTSASIQIGFYDDSSDASTSNPEKVDISLDGAQLFDSVTITSGSSSGSPFAFNTSVSLANLADGRLLVSLTQQVGDFYFAWSTLTAEVTDSAGVSGSSDGDTGGTSQVPFPPTLVLMAAGFLPLAFRLSRR